MNDCANDITFMMHAINIVPQTNITVAFMDVWSSYYDVRGTISQRKMWNTSLAGLFSSCPLSVRMSIIMELSRQYSRLNHQIIFSPERINFRKSLRVFYQNHCC